MIRLPYIELSIEHPRRYLDPQSHRVEDLVLALQDQLLKKQVGNLLRDSDTTLTTPKNTFQINLDVQHFRPDEISVKTGDGHIIVECDHEERKDHHGWVSRKFVRRYPIPEGVDPETIQSRLSSDGVLSIVAPVSQVRASNERLVPIIQTGPISKKPDEPKDEVPEAVPIQNGQ